MRITFKYQLSKNMTKDKHINYYLYSLITTLKYINRFPSYWLWFFIRTIYVIVEVFIPIAFGKIVTILSQNGDNLDSIYPYLYAYLALLVISPILEVTSGNMAWIYGYKCGSALRQDTINLLRHTPLSFWQNKDKGAVMKVIDKAYDAMTQLSGLIMHQYLWISGRVLGIIISSTFIDPVILLIYLADAVFFFINIAILLPKEQKLDLQANKLSEGLNGKIYQYLQNFRTVVYLNLFDREEKDIAEKEMASRNKNLQREKVEFWKWLNNNLLHNITTGSIIVYTIWQIQSGNLDLGILATVILFAATFTEQLGTLMWRSGEFIMFSNSFKRYHDTFGYIQQQPTKSSLSGFSFESLSFDKISLKREDRETLSNISLSFKKGQKTAIVGYTGSGKSTLLDIILKVITDHEGEVKLNNYNYADLKVADIVGIFSIVPQEVQLFKDTIRSNILAGNPNFSGSLEQIIQTAGLNDLVAKLPKGLDETVQENSLNLSGGERQRIGIARALSQQEPVLILDEATASLDPKTEREVVTRIIQNYPELTIIYVTHKYSLLNYFDQILVLDSGQVVEQGSFESLLNRGGLFKDLFQASLN